jgi:hypothetical protein
MHFVIKKTPLVPWRRIAQPNRKTDVWLALHATSKRQHKKLPGNPAPDVLLPNVSRISSSA